MIRVPLALVATGSIGELHENHDFLFLSYGDDILELKGHSPDISPNPKSQATVPINQGKDGLGGMWEECITMPDIPDTTPLQR